MAITTHTDWRTCTDPAALVERLGDTLTDGERLLILTGYIRPMWTLPVMDRIGVRAAMDRVERAAYGLLDGNVMDGATEVLEVILADMRSVDFPENNESLGVGLCHEVVRWARTRSKFGETLEWVVEQVRQYLLYRPAPPPSYVPSPHELPWDWFARIEMPGHPSVWMQCYQVAQRLMAEAIREVMPSPYARIAVERDWLDEAMVHSATGMFEAGNFDSVEQLGERFEERGCYDTDILIHCSQEERHCRGCWLVDEVTAMRHRLRCF
ncbi:hypothetical protein [Frigoriglobus tundricola]|uniref:Uncharacterized protein n=1 Tax=Frigoriglobus tundricola TaxID=2774151 RepID=A0A6M5Z0F7_9BACT|nr:hypothetical protein [Frigoriglobus tundricola]QJW98911.1 hypothetical protein FTUN_6506 [Frigoriglobus tundricola]